MKILLMCGAGASSGFMAQAMRKAAAEQGRDDIEIIARSDAEMMSNLEGTDVILMGPHLVYKEASIRESLEPYNIPLAFINKEAYGKIDGKATLQQALEVLAAAGVDIISGMAKGIDGTGQRAALNAGGKSYAVLGSGVDVCYPRDHIGLYMDIIEHGGGILSEFPPGTPPLAMNFPMRNRIISGLSDAVLVMEARVRSGSLITADMALEQGKDVYALPGPLDSPLSAGCNHLIQQGAGILLNPKNLLEEWGIETNVLCRNTEIKNEKNKKVLESTDDLVYSCVGLYPKNVDQIAQESRVEIRKLMSILVTLELQGYIREITKNYYIRIK